jgi:hypothetical protein
MLRIDSWEGAAAATAVRTAPSPSYYFRHVGESAASLARLVKDNSVEHRCVGHVTAWTHERRAPDGTRLVEDGYVVLGWTSSAILRSSLSSRLDALNPVAASRLLEAPEIRELDRHSGDFVVLRGGSGLGNDWPVELSGAISALDVDLWIGPDASDLDGAVALDFDTFRRQFAATEIAA